MQAAPKLIGQVPFTTSNPQYNLHPSRQRLPRSSSVRIKSGTICGFIVAASVVLAPLALLNVSVRALVAENGYKMQHIRAEIEDQRRMGEQIRIKNARLSNLERVKKVATEKLAMTEPDVEAKIISLPGDGVTSPEYAFLTTTKEVR